MLVVQCSHFDVSEDRALVGGKALQRAVEGVEEGDELLEVAFGEQPLPVEPGEILGFAQVLAFTTAPIALASRSTRAASLPSRRGIARASSERSAVAS